MSESRHLPSTESTKDHRLSWNTDTATQLVNTIRSVLRQFPTTLVGELRLGDHRPESRWQTVYLLAPDDGPVVVAKIPDGPAISAHSGDLVEAAGHWSFRWGAYGPSLVFLVTRLTTLGPGTQAVTALRSQLDARGLWQRRLPLPTLPTRIALVASSTSAGAADFLARLRREPQIMVHTFDVNLTSRHDIARGIAAATHDPAAFDLVAIVRGGGLQGLDLAIWSSAEVAQAIAQRQVPVITGIGHETDQTLADELADAHFITPTAAADWIVEQRQQALAAHKAEDTVQKLRRARRIQWIALGVAVLAVLTVIWVLLHP